MMPSDVHDIKWQIRLHSVIKNYTTQSMNITYHIGKNTQRSTLHSLNKKINIIIKYGDTANCIQFTRIYNKKGTLCTVHNVLLS